MSKKQFKTFCSIASYIEQVDEPLYQIINNSCAAGILFTKKIKAGATFLWPQDKKWLATLDRLAYSADPDEVEQASRMINNLIVKDKFKTAQDWLAKRDDIPNALNPSQRLEIKSASGNEVHFASGAVATLDARFIDKSEGRNISVWKLVGDIPITTDQPASLKYVKQSLDAARKRPAKTGGYELSDAQARSHRHAIALAIENTFAMRCMSGNDALSGGNGARANAFTEAAASFCCYLISHGPEEQCAAALALFTAHPVDFYFMIQPHLTAGVAPLFDDAVIDAWWADPARRGGAFGAVNMSDALGKIAAAMRKQSAACFTQRKALNGAIAVERKRLAAEGQMNRDSVSAIARVYQTLEQSNSFGGINDVFPEVLAQYYRDNAGLKRAEDGLRFITYGMFCDLECASGAFDHGLFKEILDIVGTGLHANSASARETASPLFNQSAFRYTPEPQQLIAMLRSFLCSSAFIQLPASEERANYAKSSVIRPKPGASTYFDMDGALALKHSRLLGGASGSAPDASRVIAALRAMDPSTLAPELREALAKLS